MPQLLAQVPPMIEIAKTMRDTLLSVHSTFSEMISQMERLTDTSVVMGQVFDDAKK